MTYRYPLGLLLAGALLCTGLFSVPARAQERPLHDTGQTTCYDMDGQETPCSAPGFPGFDARFGRDAAALDGVLPKHGGGTGGFDFTKISNDGGELEPEAPLGPEPENWACTQDNHTGLLWEIKISDTSSPRHYEWGFMWFDPDSEYNGGDPGFESEVGLMCGFTIECDTQAYIEYINSIGLCGRSDWRLPTLDELGGVVSYGSSYEGGGAMDRVYFADGGGYSGYGGAWTSDTGHEPEDGHAAWHINFDDGSAHQAPKGNGIGIRLVSGELPDVPGEMPVCGERHNELIRPSTAGFLHHSEPGLAWDERTGLTWSRCAIGQEFEGDGEELHCEGEPMRVSWEEAMQMVQERNDEEYGGHNDWRLPNLKELQSIAERQCFGPIVDLRMFPEEGIPYWSSTSSDWTPDAAWAIEFFGGNYHPTHKGEAWPAVRLVRGGAEFDDYQGGLSYSVGGSLTGMVGVGLGLRLETSTGESESLTLNADGAFVFSHGFSEGDGYDVTVEQPPVPYQSCTVENGSGTVNGNASDVAVVCAAPEPAQIEVSPSSFDLTVYEEGSSSGEMTITNAGGGFLDWSVDTAFPGRGLRGGVIDCEAEPGIIIQDDGTVENAISGNRFWEAGFMVVDRFTPQSYPASIGSVCLALARNGNDTSVNFDIVVLDDNGPGNSPGTVLGALAVSATNLQPYSPTSINWYSYDLSPLYTTIESGSVYVGVRFNGGSFTEPDKIASVLMDMTEDDRPAGYAGGHFWNWGQAGQWQPIQEIATTTAEYRALFVRAVEAGPQEPPVGCDAPNAIPWLDLGLTAGSTPAGESVTVSLTVNGLGMEGGTYEALLCVNSNDPENPRVEVPVSLTVNVGAAELALSPDSLDFGGVVLGASATLTATITNVGTFAATITGVEATPGVYEVEPLGDLELGPGESTTTEVTFTPVEGDAVSGTLSVFGHNAEGDELPAATATLSGVGLVPPEAAVSPESLTLEIEYGTTGTSALTLSNEAEAGALDLHFEASVAVARSRTTRLVEGSEATRSVREVDGAGLARANGSTAVYPHTVIEGAPFAYQRSNELMITHSASQAILSEHGISCGATSGSHTVENSFWRVFDLSQFPEVAGGFTVTSVDVGVESVVGPSLQSKVVLYTLSGDFTTANFTQVGEADFTLAGGLAQEVVNVPIEGEFEDTDHLVVEWRTGSGEATSTLYYPGANSAGETGPTYFSSVGCDLPEPVTMASIGFPDVHWVLNVRGETDMSLLSVSPESEMVAPGESQEITLTLDASEDLPGEYALEVVFATNDPARPSVTVPVNITVTGGASELVLNPSALDFGEVIVGLSETREVTITNVGTREATITAIESSEAVFTAAFDGPVTLAPDESTTSEVTFTPTSAGSVTGVLTVETDGADLTASLSGEAHDQPTPELSATEFEIGVEPGQTTSETLLLSNVGGDDAADLEYSVSVVAARPAGSGGLARGATGVTIGARGSDAPGSNARSSDARGLSARGSGAHGTAGVAGRGTAFVLADGSTAGAPYQPVDGPTAGVWRGDEVMITHSVSPQIEALSGVSCPTAPNHHFRVFDLSEFIDGNLEVTSVDIGIEEIVAQTTTINLYRLDGPLMMANLELVSTASLPVSPSDALTLVNVPMTGSFANDDVLVLEWLVPQSTVYFGGNELGQTGPTYVMAPGCGAPEPMDLVELGDFPNNAWVANVHGTSGPSLFAVTPESGIIAPGESDELTLFVDATEAEPGEHAFEVLIATNDPANPTLAVSVMLTIKPFVSTDDGPVPTAFSVGQNYPNPFASRTVIEYGLPEASHVTVSVYDAVGRLVATLVDGEQTAGYHEAAWEASGVASGVYLYRIQAGSYARTLKMVVVQ